MLSMTRSKRQYGSGCLLKRGKGWAIRWREIEIAPDGTKKRVLRYETLGPMSRRQAAQILAQRVATASSSTARARSLITFRTLASEELRIRQDPAARTTELLKKVFTKP